MNMFRRRNTFRPTQQPAADPSAGRYTVVKTLTIGDGGCNEGIFICRDNTTNGLVIKKKLRGQDISNGFVRQEISALRQLSHHPNINQLIDSHVDMHAMKATIYLEYCDRGTILDLINNHAAHGRSIPERFFLRVLDGVSQGLRYMHYGPSGRPNRDWNLLVHRDLKPANVFLMASPNNPYPRAVIGDFGCAASEDDIRTGKVHATICERQDGRFAPPEAPHYYRSSDMFQLGLIIACMAQLQKAVSKRSMIDNGMPLGSRYSAEINNVVGQCLARASGDRIRTSSLCSWLEKARQMGKMNGREGELILPGVVTDADNGRRRDPEPRAQEPARRRTVGGFGGHEGIPDDFGFEFPDMFGGRGGRGAGGRGGRGDFGFDFPDMFGGRGGRVAGGRDAWPF